MRQDYERLLGQLEEVLATPEDERDTRDRDSAILRFELTFEVAWKLIQRMVRDEGLDSNGPRQALENAYTLGWIVEETTWFDLMKDRNLAIHVYREEWAEALYARLPAYLDAFVSLAERLPPTR